MLYLLQLTLLPIFHQDHLFRYYKLDISLPSQIIYLDEKALRQALPVRGTFPYLHPAKLLSLSDSALLH